LGREQPGGTVNGDHLSAWGGIRCIRCLRSCSWKPMQMSCPPVRRGAVAGAGPGATGKWWPGPGLWAATGVAGHNLVAW